MSKGTAPRLNHMGSMLGVHLLLLLLLLLCAATALLLSAAGASIYVQCPYNAVLEDCCWTCTQM
jgi:hypothetical protein